MLIIIALLFEGVIEIFEFDQDLITESSDLTSLPLPLPFPDF